MSALERALRQGERLGDLSRAFVAGERFREFTMEPRRVGRLTVKSNSLAVVDPFGLGFGFQTLARKVPRGRFPVEVAVAHYRKGPRKGEQRVALARIRLGQGKATGYRLAEVPGQPERRWLGAKFGGYAVESGFGAFACGAAAQALDEACGAAFDEGELDHPQSRMLREQLTHPDALARGWGSGELVPVMREGSLVAFTAGHGEGFYPSYWGYDDERRLVSLVTDFLVLPTDPELIRASWAGRTWRELHYDGDRGQRFWRVKVQGRVRTIEHGYVGKRGQASEKEFTTSEAAFEAAAKGIHRQLDAGYFELSSSASDLRRALSGVVPKLGPGTKKKTEERRRRRAKGRGVLVEAKPSASTKDEAKPSEKRKRSKRSATHDEPKPSRSKSKRKSSKAKPSEAKREARSEKPSKAKRASSEKAKARPKSKNPTKAKRARKAEPKAEAKPKATKAKAKGKGKAKTDAKAKAEQKTTKAKAKSKQETTKAKAKTKTKTDTKAKSKKKKAPSARLAKLKAKAPAARPRRW